MVGLGLGSAKCGVLDKTDILEKRKKAEGGSPWNGVEEEHSGLFSGVREDTKWEVLEVFTRCGEWWEGLRD